MIVDDFDDLSDGSWEYEIDRLRAELEAVKKERDELVAALTELVACKDLAEKFDSLKQNVHDFATAAVVDGVQAEYLRRKPVAWAAARTALAKIGADKTGEKL